jgi:hypothetical protein
MRSKDCAITALTPSRLVPLAAQSRDEPLPYSLAGEDHQRRAFGLVLHGGVVDRASPRRRVVDRVAAFDTPVRSEHLVLDADVGEGAAHHDLVVAAARAVLS